MSFTEASFCKVLFYKEPLKKNSFLRMSQHRGEGYVCYSRFIGNEQAIQKLKFVMAEEGNIR
jgi:hypothetical protein